ncbi:MAG: hypothetical protein V7776_12415 [Halopseudomonas aestusnigri]
MSGDVVPTGPDRNRQILRKRQFDRRHYIICIAAAGDNIRPSVNHHVPYGTRVVKPGIFGAVYLSAKPTFLSCKGFS